ncbi:MAG: VCBS repeat-containing protein [Myxococcota bacterium]
MTCSTALVACSTPGTVNTFGADEDEEMEVDTDTDGEESSGGEEAFDPFEGARVIETGLEGRFEFGDYDGDGVDDLISADGDWLRVHRFDNGEQVLEQLSITSFNTYFDFLIPAHVDGDDQLDLVLYNAATPLIGQYDNRLTPVAFSSDGVEFGPVVSMGGDVMLRAAVDFDGDGRVDLLERSFNALRIWSTNRDGTWTEGQSLAGLPYVEIRGAIWHDVTLDGRLDLMLWGHDSGRTYLATYTQDEEGHLSVLQERELEFMGDARLADFDDDGIVDLALSRARWYAEDPTAALLVLQGRGDGTYGGSLLHFESGPDDVGDARLIPVDLDGDGAPEPIVINTGTFDPETYEGLLPGFEPWTPVLVRVEDEVTFHPLPSGIVPVDAADLDGDDCEELVGASDNQLVLLELPCD